MSGSQIAELSARIAANTAKVDEYLATHDLPQPSFGLEAPQQGVIPKDAVDIQALRQAIIQDTQELHDLMLEPREYLLGHVHNSLLPQQAVVRFNLARSFPVGETTTFAEMAKSAGLAERDVRKLVRYAITQRIFTEPQPGVVAHSAISRALAEDSGLHDFVAACTDDLWQAAAHTCEAMTKWPGSEELAETGFALANQTDKPIYQFFSDHPDRARRFANMMKSFTQGPGFDLKHLTDNYPWQDIGDGTVVDVGGSQGFACIALARKFPSLSFVVQDLEPVIEAAKEDASQGHSDRIRFMVHDFFTTQPVHGADVYLFRWIFHNWPDKYCIKILRNLVPALKPGARVIINDGVMPGPGKMPKAMEARMRSFDLVMTAIQNAKEREASEWAELFRAADARFHFQGVTQPPGSNLALLVAEFRDD